MNQARALAIVGALLSGASFTAGGVGGRLTAPAPPGVAALGATGMFGTWGSAISTVLSAFTQAKAQPKS